jgi:mono/diheme cytochrome c family protein
MIEYATYKLAVVMPVALAVFLSGCRRDMGQQSYHRPLDASEVFADRMASRPLVEHTIARGQLHEDEQFFTGRLGGQPVNTFPAPVTRETLERGRQRFEIYCAVCHGRTGEGNGMIVHRGFPAPPSFHLDRLREAPVGHIVEVINNGYGLMYSYASRVEPADRWAIAAYIRALQLSQHATLTDAPPTERARLQQEAPQ